MDYSAHTHGHSSAILDFVEKNRSKSLNICTGEIEEGICYYNILRIKFGDLFTFQRFSSKSSDRRDTLLQHLASLKGSGYPQMGYGFFGSQVIFAGGSSGHDFCSKNTYCCETHPDKPKPEFRKGSTLEGMKSTPLVLEINGKLYILGRNYFWCGPSGSGFEVFDGEWSPLPNFPLPATDGEHCKSFGCAVVGTKFLCCTYATSFERQLANESPVFCFDVASSKKEWCYIPDMIFPFWGKALVLDLDAFKDRKFVFAVDHFDLLGVFLMKLEDDGTPSSIEQVFSYDLAPDDVESYTLSHLGDGKVCFVTSLCYDAGVQFMITTFEFSFIQRMHANEEPATKRRTVEVLPSIDGCDGFSSDCKVFLKVLGELFFDYSWTEWTEQTKRNSWTEWSEPPKRVPRDDGGRRVIPGASSVF